MPQAYMFVAGNYASYGQCTWMSGGLTCDCEQKVLGRGLKDLPRDQIVVATKVGRYGQDVFDFSVARVKVEYLVLPFSSSLRQCPCAAKYLQQSPIIVL